MPFPICGVPLDTYITVTIDSEGNASLRWGDAYGYTYKSWATSIYANKAVSLTADSAQERTEADIDIMKAIGSNYLGMTKDEIIAATGLNPDYQGRLTNNEGVGIVTYRNNSNTATVPEAKGDFSVLSQFGFSGEVGEVYSNSFHPSSNRLFFSDYFNSSAEVEVKIGKIQYDSNSKATSITVWVRQVKGSGAVPEEFQQIIVTS